MRRPRKLSQSDQDVWDHVRASVTPLREQESDEALLDSLIDCKLTKGAASFAPQARPEIDLKAVIPKDDLEGMMKSRRRQVTKGRLDPSAKIDLHGLRLENARTRFRSFVIEHVNAQHKMLLVVTGKGGYARPTDFGHEVSGVIRRAFPDWIHEPDIARLVSHYCPAHVRHGGDGAFYIFTRAKARR